MYEIIDIALVNFTNVIVLFGGYNCESVNTSLNVGGPIVQTPCQALKIFTKAKGMDGMVMVGASGEAFLLTP